METARDIRLSAQLAEMEQRWKLVRFAKSGGYALLLLLSTLAVAAVLDRTLTLSIIQRRLLSVACYGTVLSFAWFGWLRPFRQPVGPRAMAWMLEDAVPELNEKLISAVEFSSDTSARTSLELIGHVLDEAEVDLLKISPRKVFPICRYHFLVPAMALTAFIVSLCIPTMKTARLIKRVVYPSARDATAARFDLSIVKPGTDTRAEGDTVSFVVRCTDASVRNATLCVDDYRVKRYTMQYDNRTGLFMFSVPDVRSSFEYWAAEAGTTSARHHISVRRRPRIESFTIHYEFPPYTGLPKSTTRSVSGDLRAYRGSTVTLDIRATMPLEQMVFNGTGCRSNEQDAWQRSLPLDDTGAGGRLRFKIAASGSYAIFLRDLSGLENLNPLVYSVVAIDDNAPTVELEHPISDLYLDAGGSAALAWTAEDDFGVDHVELHYTVNGAGEKFLTLDTAVPSYTWPMQMIRCGQGDEVAYFVRVYDASGHSSDSPARRISIVGTQRLRNAGLFMASAQALNEHLTTIRKRLDAARDLYENIRSARNHPQRVLAETLAHNLKVMREHHVRLAREIDVAETGAAALAAYGFFPRAGFYSDMMVRYFRQERLFFSDDNLDSLGRMLDLTAGMTSELINKAAEQAPGIQLEGIILAAASRPTSATRVVLTRQAEEIARSGNTIFTGDFDSGRPQPRIVHGLRGAYYRNIDLFTAQEPAAGPEFTRIDQNILFPNGESFGAGEPPFSVRWSGLLAADKAGVHTFFLALDGKTRLFLDGRPLIIVPKYLEKPDEQSARIELDAGLHSLHLQYVAGKGNGSLALHWAPPEGAKQLLTQPALIADHPDAFAARLRALANYINDRAGDYRALDGPARSIAGNIKPADKRILDLARELELYNRETDWHTVKGLAEEMAAVADDTTDDAEQLKKRRDFLSVAEILEHAAADRDTEPLHTVAAALPALEQQAELNALRAMIKRTAHDVRVHTARIGKEIADGQRPVTAHRELDGLQERVRTAHDVALSAATFNPTRRLTPAADSLGQVENLLSGTRAALVEMNTAAAATNLTEVGRALKVAEDTINALALKADKARDAARLVLSPLATDNAGRLAALRDRLSRLPGQLTNQNVTRADIAGAARELENIDAGLGSAADRIRAQARIMLSPTDPDMASATWFAAAAAIDGVRAAPVAEAARLLLAPAPETNDRANTAAAAEHLQRALHVVGDTHSLLRRCLADDNGLLSEEQQHRYATDLARFLERHLPPELRGGIASFDRLARIAGDAETLAGNASRLRTSPDTQKTGELAGAADALDRRVTAMLNPDSPGITNAPSTPLPDTPVPPPPTTLILDALDRIAPLMVEAEAAEAAAATIDGEIHPHELDALRLIDEVPLDGLSPAERRAVDAARQRAADGRCEEKVRQLQAITALLGDRDPDLRKRITDAAAQLAIDSARAEQAERLRTQAARTLAEMQSTISTLAAAPAESSAAPSWIRHTLQSMANNIARRDFAAVRKNAANIEKDLLRPATGTNAGGGPDPGALLEDGIHELNAALRLADPAGKSALTNVLTAATAGEPERAASLARQIAAPATNAATAVRAIRAVDNHARRTARPIAEALTEARAGRFARAAFMVRHTGSSYDAADILTAVRDQLRHTASRMLNSAHLSGDGNVNSTLNAAARFALTGNMAEAITQARAAGKDGEDHLRVLERILDMSGDAVRELERLESDSRKVAAELGASAETALAAVAAELDERRTTAAGTGDDTTAHARGLVEKAQACMRQGDLAGAIEAADEAGGGAVHLIDAATMFATAAATESTQPADPFTGPGQAGTRQKELAAFLKGDGAQAAELVAAASKSITAARERMAAGAIDDDTVAALGEAATALNGASRTVLDVVLARQDTSVPTTAALSATGLPAGTNDNGRVAVGSNATIVAPSGVPITDPWTGVSTGLTGSGDRIGVKAEYNDYYRKAIKTYFQSIPGKR